MKKNLAALAVPLLFSLSIAAGPVLADDHGESITIDRVFIDRDVDTFAVLPNGIRLPEGITANPANGDIYVANFDGGNRNVVLRYDRHGHLLATRDFGITPLLGLEFDAAHKKVYVLNVGDFTGVPGLNSKIQRIAADFNSATPIEDVSIIPPIGAPAKRDVVKGDNSVDTIFFAQNARVPNAMTFDHLGNLYVSDSFQGAVFKVTNVANCATPCSVDTVSHDPLFATPGFPPFGANGLAFNANETVLFVANTGDDRVLALDMATKNVTVFSESLNGADGLVFDKRSGLLWVCANQADEVVALNANGRVVAVLGEFRGINSDGTPNGLLFPASPVIVGDEIFVTNLAIALTPAVGDEPEEDVKLWTVSKLRLPH
jgi:DNA-binding beta-propeller fold protein YncE